MTISSTSPPGIHAASNTDIAANPPSPRLHNACGLLTVREFSQYMQPSPQAEAQFEEALRAIDNTATGAAVLRAIEACGVAAHRRPVCIFYERDPLDGNEPEFERVGFDGIPVINFNVLPSHAEGDERKRAYRLMTVFAELISLYAGNMGEPCADPTAGFQSFRMAAFREEIGHPAPQWLADIDDYVLEGASTGEDRRAIKDIIADWVDAGDPEADLDLSYQNLELGSFPPLRNLQGLRRLNVAGNSIGGFPSMDRLPPTLRDISLAGNPVETGAEEYGPDLRLVVLSLPAEDIEHFRTLFPPEVRIHKADAGLIDLFRRIEGLRRGVVSDGALRAAGYTDEKTAEVFPAQAFVDVVEPWLQPYPMRELAWLKAHQERANLTVGMINMLDRLAEMPAAKDPAFRAKFADLLNKMQQPGHEQFFTLCLEIAGAGAESCNDRILETVNELFIAWQGVDSNTGIWDPGMDLARHARQAFALGAAKQFISREMPRLKERFEQAQREKRAARAGANPREEPREELDQLEQFLALRTRIAERDPDLLPPMQFEMQFGGLSILNDEDIDKALDHIEKTRETGWMTFLADWKPLRIVIRGTAPALIEREEQLRKHINNDRGRLYKWFGQGLNGSGTMLFPVKYRVFWTRYERQVDRKLAEFGAGRDDEKIVEQAAAEVKNDIEFLLRSHTIQQFALSKGQYSNWRVRLPEQPTWFKKLIRDA